MSTIGTTVVQPAVAGPGVITLAEWDEVYSRRDDAYELVQGVPTVSPNESMVNLVLAAELGAIIRSATRREFVAPSQVSVTLVPTDPPTVRRPDLVVCRRDVVRDVRRMNPTDVEMVVEVLSPGSIERDRVTKMREYAQAGIPAYLIVDRFAQRLMLCTDPRGDAYRTVTSVDDPDPLTLRLREYAFTVRLSDLR